MGPGVKATYGGVPAQQECIVFEGKIVLLSAQLLAYATTCEIPEDVWAAHRVWGLM